VTPDNSALRKLMEQVAAALGESVEYVSLTYECMDGQFLWNCTVKPRYRKRGTGREMVRGSFCTVPENGEGSPAEVVADMLHKIENYKNPAAAEAAKNRESVLQLLSELLDSGELTLDQYTSAVGKLPELP
jgi:hypothetical protein